MKTTEMETIYDLGVKMIEAIQKEKVRASLHQRARQQATRHRCSRCSGGTAAA
jgi:hypothetical protein